MYVLSESHFVRRDEDGNTMIDTRAIPDFIFTESVGATDSRNLYRRSEMLEKSNLCTTSGDKNNSARVEQENYHIIRQVSDLHRYQSAGERVLLSKTWQQQRLLTSHFAPQ